MKIEFSVPGEAIAQPRQRTRVMQFAGKAIAQNYTPGKHPVNVFKAAIQMAARMAHAGPLIASPVEIEITATFARPAARTWKTKPMPREPKTGKPDWDNLSKAICDALNGVLWKDDSQVWRAVVTRYVVAGDEAPATRIVVKTLEGAIA